MTNEELRAHWGETAPAPRPSGPVPPWLVLALIGAALLAVALVVLPGLALEADKARAREIRQCEMTLVRSGEVDPAGAELLCARDGWEQ